MNAKKNMKTLIAAGLCAAMMTAPACMLAAETSAHVPNSVETQRIGEKIPPMCGVKEYRGVNVSSRWMRQARLDGMMLNLRLHTPMGEEVTFREMLKYAPSDLRSMCLYLQASRSGEPITLQLDQPAIDVLDNLSVIEIVVADLDGYVRAHYKVSELKAVREALGLKAAEQLCVTGEDAPVTVVSEDGVRHQINP